MIGVIKKLFEPSKAHKYGLDYTAEAEEMFRRVAADLDLEIIKLPDDPVELSMEFPKQRKLDWRIWVCLQNLDELWISVGGFTTSMFPFEDVKETFESMLREFLTKTYKVRRFKSRRTGKICQSLTYENTEKGWRILSINGLKFLPDRFFDIEEEIIANGK